MNVIKAPTKSERATPKHAPGVTVGSNTPRDIPTPAALIVKMYIATTERFIPTGTNSGSRNVKARDPDTTAVKIPAKNLGFLML
jgi:hypothetical protein